MLLDIWSVLGGVGLAAVAFIVVILVCVVILRLLAAILPSYEDLESRSSTADEGVPVNSPESTGGTPEPGAGQEAGVMDVGDESRADRAKQSPVPDEAGPG